jgi:uncharacterized protein YegP (UPF0339 family)
MVKLKKISDSKFQFEVATTAGAKLLNSIYFSSKKELNSAVLRLPTVVESSTNFERKTDYSGRFIFHVKDTSGNTLGHSDTYTSEAGMENGIKNLKKHITLNK